MIVVVWDSLSQKGFVSKKEWKPHPRKGKRTTCQTVVAPKQKETQNKFPLHPHTPAVWSFTVGKSNIKVAGSVLPKARPSLRTVAWWREIPMLILRESKLLRRWLSNFQRKTWICPWRFRKKKKLNLKLTVLFRRLRFWKDHQPTKEASNQINQIKQTNPDILSDPKPPNQAQSHNFNLSTPPVLDHAHVKGVQSSSETKPFACAAQRKKQEDHRRERLLCFLNMNPYIKNLWKKTT